jgi:hypothetical protein
MIWKYKNKLIWIKEKIKKFKIWKKCFKNTKTSRVLRNSIKKKCKNCFTKTSFQTQFFGRPHSIKYNLIYYQTPNCVFYTANVKVTTKQIHPKWTAASAVQDTK